MPEAFSKKKKKNMNLIKKDETANNLKPDNT